MEARSRTAAAQPRYAPRSEISFSERYRGTEYETSTAILVTQAPLVSRGRSFVLVAGAAVVGISGLLLTATPG